MRDAPKPDWAAVTAEALREPASLARVVAGMGFSRHLGELPRGSIAWWTPDYASGEGARRHGMAALNRSMRDAAVILLAHQDRVIAVDSRSGEWRSADGAQAGADLPSLGALMWGCRYGQAAGRIARILGLRQIPEAEAVAAADIWRDIHARLAKEGAARA